MNTAPTTHFAAQHIDGGVVLTVTDFRDGYITRVADPKGVEMISFQFLDLGAAVAAAVEMIEEDI